MHSEQESPARKRRLKPIWILAALLALGLLVLIGLRIRSWNAQRQEARVLALVNPWNSVDSSDFIPRLNDLGGVQVDSSCAKALQEMLADCRAAGFTPGISAAYRSREEQLAVFDEEMLRLQNLGMPANDAYDRAAQLVGAPDASEHELGLAVDIQGEGAQAWLRENSWRYGFILRYPEGSEEITGMAASPAHFRYVGQAAAEQIETLDITLEEYLGLFFNESAEIIFED